MSQHHHLTEMMRMVTRGVLASLAVAVVGHHRRQTLRGYQFLRIVRRQGGPEKLESAQNALAHRGAVAASAGGQRISEREAMDEANPYTARIGNVFRRVQISTMRTTTTKILLKSQILIHGDERIVLVFRGSQQRTIVKI